MKQPRVMSPAKTDGAASNAPRTSSGVGLPLMASSLNAAVLQNMPQSKIWGTKVSKWTSMLSPPLQICTIAGAGHLIQTWTSELGKEVLLPDSVIQDAYSQFSGYDPKSGAGDDGAVLPGFLDYWASTGVGGHTINRYLALEPGNTAHIQIAVFAFGGCLVVLDLPLSAQSQNVWSVPPQGTTGTGAPGSLYSHVVPIIGYDPLYLTIVTWGQVKRMTWGFLTSYWDQAYAVFSQKDFVNQQGVAPNGLTVPQLQADWGLL